MFRPYSFFLLFFLLILGHYATAQYGSFGLTDARQLGMGNTYAINSRGLYAAGKNPSLLAYQVDNRRLEILFPALSLREYNVAKVSDLIDDFFSQSKIDIITGIDGSIIKNAFDNGGKLYIGLQIGFIGASYTHSEKIGTFSYVMKDFIDGYLQLPTAVLDHLNSGTDTLHAIYFRDFNFQTTWMRSYEVSYGRSLFPGRIDGIKALYAGIGIKYYQGFVYDNISFSAGSGYNDESGILVGTYQASRRAAYSDDINVDNLFQGEQVMSHVPFMDPVGQGMGVDFGFALQSERGIDVGISFTDLGFINWSGKTKSTTVSGIVRIDSTLTIDDIDSLARLITIEKESADQFKTRPVSALHVGMSFNMEKFIKGIPGELGLTLEMHQGLVDDLINPEFPRLAAGLNWKAGKWYPVLLTGISTSLNNSMVWSLGLGYELSFLHLYLTLPNMLPVIEGKGMNTVSLSASWRFIKQKEKKK